MSKKKITKAGDPKRGDTKIKRRNPGGAKVSMGVQRRYQEGGGT